MKYINQLAVLLFFWSLGELVGRALEPLIRFPGTVLGMLLLFIALSLGWVKEDYIGNCTDFFLSNIGFFFVPVVVGLVTITGLSGMLLMQLTAVSVISTVITMALTALTVQTVILHLEEKK